MKKRVIRKVIYELRDPDTNIPVYVGATQEPYYRYYEHLAPSRIKRIKNPVSTIHYKLSRNLKIEGVKFCLS